VVNEIKAYLKAALLIYGGTILLILYIAMFSEIGALYGVLHNKVSVEQIAKQYPPIVLVYKGDLQ